MQIKKNFWLKAYNTFTVDVQADFFVEIKDEQEIFDLISMDVFSTQARLILGGGANILFTKNYKWLVVKISLLGKKVIKEKWNKIYIKVGAGENWHDFVMWTLEQWYVGAENMVFIPGQVWSAPVGNIGAYGTETKDILYEVEGIDIETQEKKVRTNTECNFAYRESIFKKELKNKVIITAVIFILEKESNTYIPNSQYTDIQNFIAEHTIEAREITAQKVADIIVKIREGKLPDWKKIGTAGSFFKNPVITTDLFVKLLVNYPELKWNIIQGKNVHSTFNIQHSTLIKLSAGQLIDLAGYKWKFKWPVGTYNNHALIIVNTGGASGEEIRAFAQSIQKKVLELFEVELEPEVIIL